MFLLNNSEIYQISLRKNVFVSKTLLKTKYIFFIIKHSIIYFK